MSTWQTKDKADRLARRTFIKYHGYAPDDIPDNELKYWGKNPYENVKKILGTYKKTRKPCSRFCCGNPRHFLGNGKNGKTFQETKRDIADKCD